MFGAPSIVPEVGYGLYLPRFHACFSWVGKYPRPGKGCQESGTPYGALQITFFGRQALVFPLTETKSLHDHERLALASGPLRDFNAPGRVHYCPCKQRT